MKVMHSSLSLHTTSPTIRVLTFCNLRICHPLSLTSSFLTLLPPTQRCTNISIKFDQIYKPTSVSSSGSSIKASMASSATKPFSVLFVCLGNICRSPAAEGVFRDIVKKRGLDSNFNIDSAGTVGFHEGDLADPRMRAAAKRRGIEITSISRPIKPSDFKDFDLILAMDKQNSEDILGAFNKWKFKEQLPEDAHKKVRLMCSYCKKHDETEVPDPYYGGPQGFEKVIYVYFIIYQLHYEK
ncbi:hypothetical protein Patl1_30469 [Pistacia atlantica]|uniref:Uncharacterized protein n=1 Tax=Pistacia atlantica TaxID=434234 RepID=A0ACC1AAM2_9ROSI|nr:hypothetical protein Patl1_30469 [Pistacia atlantica]